MGFIPEGSWAGSGCWLVMSRWHGLVGQWKGARSPSAALVCQWGACSGKEGEAAPPGPWLPSVSLPRDLSAVHLHDGGVQQSLVNAGTILFY